MNKKNILISFALISITLLTSCGGGEAKIETNKDKPIDTTWESASESAKNMKVGWNLGNTLDCTDYKNSRYDTEVSWGNPRTTKKMIDSVKEKGFKSIRIPITWRNHIDTAGNIDKEWLDRVETVVNYAYDNQMYAIINMHHDTGENGWLKAEESNFEANKTTFENIWKQIGTRFANYDKRLLFEGINELISDSNEWVFPSESNLNAVNKFNQLFVDTIRGLGGNNEKRNLIVPTYAASSSGGAIGGFNLPEDKYSNHLMVELHTYNPWMFCSSNTMGWSGILKSNIEGDFKRIRSSLGDLPIIIGEFGCVHKKDHQQEVNYMKDTCEVLKNNNLVPFVWDDGGSFGILNRRNLSWEDYKPGYVNAMMEVYNS